MERPIVDMMNVSLQRIKEMVDVNTIIGETITTPDGISIIPVSKLTLGFASGGSDFSSKNANQTSPNFGGGAGSGVNITPVAFLIVSKGDVKLLPVTQPAGGTLDRAVEMIPSVIEKITSMFGKKDETEESTEIAEA